MELTIQLTPQGLLIDHPLIREWLTQGIEVVPQNGAVMLRPKIAPGTRRLSEILAQAGLLVHPKPLPINFTPLSLEQQAELSRKFSIGRPLSEIIMEERGDRI
jgi:hypothetical protein